MRIRNLKNKEQILDNSNYLVSSYKENRGKWKKVFKNNNPIYVEIGMGKGKFIIENAKKYPNINFIGIERFDSIIARALIKLKDEKIDNLLLIRMNALEIDEVFNKEIDRIYLNFSDPWPKKRHINRRLTSKIFLDKYEKIMNTKEIYLRTDNKDLFIYSLESFSQNNYILSNISFDLHEDEENLITTEYEDKFSKNNMPIYSAIASKK